MLIENGADPDLPCGKVPPIISVCIYLGKGMATNLDDFLEKFQTAFDPPPHPHFWKFHCAFFAKICKYAFTCVNLQ